MVSPYKNHILYNNTKKLYNQYILWSKNKIQLNFPIFAYVAGISPIITD